MPVLADLTIGGQPRKVVMVANRNGFFYVFDRATGQLLVGKPFSDTTWARELDKDGHPIVLNEGDKGCLPDQWGSTNYMPPSYDPALRLLFVTVRETCAYYQPVKEEIVPGRISNSGTVRRDAEHSYGVLRAFDPVTVERKWEFKYPTPTMAGVMSTASGVVFAGDNEGNFMAFDGTHRQEPVVLLDRRADLGRGADDLHARRPAACRDRVGHDDHGVFAA